MIRPEKCTDEYQMLSEVRRGSEEAFERLFDAYKDKIYAFSYKVLKSKDLADDIVIDVFTKVWEKRSKIQPDRAFYPYLFKVAKNHIINFLNKASVDSKVQKQLITSVNYYRSSTEEEVIYNDYLTLAEQAISQMPRQRRQVFRLKNEEAMTYEQIASHLGLSKNTVKSHLLAATAHLRNVLNMHPEKLAVLLPLLSYHLEF